MPEEIFVIAMTALVCGTGVVLGIIRSIVGYQRAKLESKRAPGDSSLTTSELQRIIQAAVEQATRPLEQKIDAIQADLRAEGPPRTLAEPGKRGLLDGVEPVAEDEPAPASRRRVR